MPATVNYLLPPEERRLIQHIARRVYTRHTPAGSDGRAMTEKELFHHGVIGLLEARKKFDSEGAASWLVYAAYRIEGAMIDSLRKAPLVRLPHEVQHKVRKLNQARERLENENRPTDTTALAAELDWSRSEVEKIMGFVPTIVKAVTENESDAEGNRGRDGVVLVDTGSESNPAENLLRRELSHLLAHCLEALPETRDRIIVKARKLENITLRELAETFACSIENIRKREQAALRQLKDCLQRGGWQGF